MNQVFEVAGERGCASTRHVLQRQHWLTCWNDDEVVTFGGVQYIDDLHSVKQNITPPLVPHGTFLTSSEEVVWEGKN